MSTLLALPSRTSVIDFRNGIVISRHPCVRLNSIASCLLRRSSSSPRPARARIGCASSGPKGSTTATSPVPIAKKTGSMILRSAPRCALAGSCTSIPLTDCASPSLSTSTPKLSSSSTISTASPPERLLRCAIGSASVLRRPFFAWKAVCVGRTSTMSCRTACGVISRSWWASASLSGWNFRLAMPLIICRREPRSTTSKAMASSCARPLISRAAHNSPRSIPCGMARSFPTTCRRGPTSLCSRTRAST